MASSSERPAWRRRLCSMRGEVSATSLRRPSTSVTPSVAGRSAATTAATAPSASSTGATPLTHTPHWSTKRTFASSVAAGEDLEQLVVGDDLVADVRPVGVRLLRRRRRSRSCCRADVGRDEACRRVRVADGAQRRRISRVLGRCSSSRRRAAGVLVGVDARRGLSGDAGRERGGRPRGARARARTRRPSRGRTGCRCSARARRGTRRRSSA